MIGMLSSHVVLLMQSEIKIYGLVRKFVKLSPFSSTIFILDLVFFMNVGHGNRSCHAIFKQKLHICNQNIVFYDPVKNKPSSLKDPSIRNFTSFFPTLPHPPKVCL